MRRSLFFILLSTTMLIVSCRENSSDTSAPVVTISSPAENQSFANGQIMNLRGTFTDNELHEVKMTITNDANGAELYIKYISIHGSNSYPLNESWTVIASSNINATLKIEVTDYSGNKGEKKVAIKLTP